MLFLISLAALTSVVYAKFHHPSTQNLLTYPNIEACVGLPVQYSCENTTVLTDSCCNVVQGGLVLQTQYWNTYTGLESQGQLLPQGSWSIHGLWPDNCDGSFDQYCDLSRQYDPTPSPSTLPDGTTVPPYKGPSVRTFIQDFGRSDLLKYMDAFWINLGAPNDDFWAHEFSKHATCTSTFDVACYEPGYQEHQEVVNFYETVTKVFQMYPTYNMLAAAGILPSNTTTYTLSQITNALYSQTGAVPYLGCYGQGTILDEVWYFHHVLGTEQYGHFKTLNSTTPSSCMETGIWYYERTATSEQVTRAFTYVVAYCFLLYKLCAPRTEGTKTLCGLMQPLHQHLEGSSSIIAGAR